MSASTADLADVPVAAPAAPARSRRPFVIGLLLVLGLSVVGYEVLSTWGKETTDNAAVDGHVVTVGSRISGQISAIRVREGQPVREGEVLATLDGRDAKIRVAASTADLEVAQAALDTARANLSALTGSTAAQLDGASAAVRTARSGVGTSRDGVSQAESALKAAQARASQAATDRTRAESLFASGGITRQALDTAITTDVAATATLDQATAALSVARQNVGASSDRLDEAIAREAQANTGGDQVAAAMAQIRGAEARVAQAQAALDGANLQLSYTEIKAPFDGVIARRGGEVGQIVTGGSGLFGLVGTKEVWIIANFKETQIEGMKAGQVVDVEIDGLSQSFEGVVDAVTPSTGGRWALIPQDNSAGNFTKVVQRVPVRIALPHEAEGLVRPGESAVVTVHVR